MYDCWKKCSKFDQKSQNLKKMHAVGSWTVYCRLSSTLNGFNHCPITGKVIMCHDTIYFESLLWGIGHRITVFSWKFDICSFVGLSIARIALRATKTPPFFKKLGGYDPRSRCSPTERSARLACFARMTTPLPPPPNRSGRFTALSALHVIQCALNVHCTYTYVQCTLYTSALYIQCTLMHCTYSVHQCTVRTLYSIHLLAFTYSSIHYYTIVHCTHSVH